MFKIAKTKFFKYNKNHDYFTHNHCHSILWFSAFKERFFYVKNKKALCLVFLAKPKNEKKVSFSCMRKFSYSPQNNHISNSLSLKYKQHMSVFSSLSTKKRFDPLKAKPFMECFMKLPFNNVANNFNKQWNLRNYYVKSFLRNILLVNFPEKEKDFLIKNLAAENKISLVTESAGLLLKDSRNNNELIEVEDPIEILFDKVKTLAPCICVRADF